MKRVVWESDQGPKISFGTGLEDTFLLNTLDGNDLAGEAETVKQPRSHGQRAVCLTLGARGLHLEGSVHAVGNESLPARLVLDRLTEQLAEAFAPHRQGTLIYYTEAGPRQIRCRPTALPAFGDRVGCSRTVDISFVADFPFWESLEEQVVRVGVMDARFSFPTSFDWVEFGHFTAVAVIDNPRGEAAYPVVEVFTAGNGTTLINEATGQKIRVEHAIGAGQKLVIHTDPVELAVEVWQSDDAGTWTLADDVTHWLSLDSLPFWLAPGRNQVYISNDNAAQVPVTEIRYRHRFLGVG